MLIYEVCLSQHSCTRRNLWNINLRALLNTDSYCLCRDVHTAVAPRQCCSDCRQSHGHPRFPLPSGWRIQSGDQQRDAAGRRWLRVSDQWWWQSRSDPHRRDTGWVTACLLMLGGQTWSWYVPVTSLQYLPSGVNILGIFKLLITLHENLHSLLEGSLHLKSQHFKVCYIVFFLWCTGVAKVSLLSMFGVLPLVSSGFPPPLP